MTNIEAKEFVNNVFEKIKNCKSINEIDNIQDLLGIQNKNRMDSISYPEINFQINGEEIKNEIIGKYIHEKDLTFLGDISKKLNDPLVKLLYAIVWKNGDLKKIKHIIKGIMNVKKEEDDQNEALVFYQFGKYLTKTPGQPIIDQHVIRAFAVYRNLDSRDIEKIRKVKVLNQKHKPLINDYINWISGDELTEELRSETNYSYHIDKLLFAVGKTIK